MQLFIYLIGVILFASGFYFIKKSDNVWNGVCHIFVSIVFLMLTQSLLCIANDMLKFPLRAWQYAIPEIAVGVYWWYMIIFKKKVQKYEYHILDVVVVVVMAAITVIWGIHQFGPGLENFNYRTMDSGNHLYFTRQLIKGEPETFMHFAAVNTGVWISAFRGIIPVFYEYKIYIIFDLFVLFLNGVMMLTCLRIYMTKTFTKIVGAVFSIFYMCGHPLSSVVFGTAYFSTGMMLVIVIVYFTGIVLNREVNKEWSEALIAFSVLGLAYSYFLFIPPVIGGTFIYLFYENKVRKNQVTHKLIRNSVIVWSILFILGVFYLYEFYVAKNAVIFNSLFYEGCMYGHPYGDFLFFVPFLILLAVSDIKSKKIGFEEFLFTMVFGMLIVLALGTVTKSVSSYYFYKIYAPLWGLAFICTMKYIASMKKEQYQFCTAVFVPWLLMFACFIGRVENKIYDKNYRFGLEAGYENVSESLFPVYSANRRIVHELDGLKDLNKLMMKSAKFAADRDIYVPYVGNGVVEDPKTKVCEIFDIKYYSLSNQYSELGVYSHEGTFYIDKIISGERDYKYIMVVYDKDGKDATEGKIDKKKIIFKNKAGYLAEIR